MNDKKYIKLNFTREEYNKLVTSINRKKPFFLHYNDSYFNGEHFYSIISIYKFYVFLYLFLLMPIIFLIAIFNGYKTAKNIIVDILTGNSRDYISFDISSYDDVSNEGVELIIHKYKLAAGE
jgi:hypothetical protein